MDDNRNELEWNEETMNSIRGMRIPFTNIAVDLWKPSHPSIRHFFLTHLHADHTEGLNHSWHLGTIYCTETTKNLLLKRFLIDAQLVIGLQEGRTSTICLDDQRDIAIQVTTIPANHCPGAAMFLMEGYFGRYLYTGDFRYDNNFAWNHLLENQMPIDHLFLDTTYCNSKYRHFLDRNGALSAIVKIIDEKRDHDVVIGIDSLGKEEILLDLAKYFNTKLVVSFDRMEAIESMEEDIDPSYFTTTNKEGFIKVISKKSLTSKSLDYWNSIKPTIGILISGFATQLLRTSGSRDPRIYAVPYSLHSSFTELKNFVSLVRPRKITPLTTADVSCFNEFLDTTPSLRFQVPDAIYTTSEKPKIKQEDTTQDTLQDRKSALELIKKFYPSCPEFEPKLNETTLDQWSSQLQNLLKSTTSKRKILEDGDDHTIQRIRVDPQKDLSLKKKSKKQAKPPQWTNISSPLKKVQEYTCHRDKKKNIVNILKDYYQNLSNQSTSR